MRITNTILFNTTLANIQQYNARLLQTYTEASSGRRLQRPSDDPTGTRRVLDLRGRLSSLEQFKSQQVNVIGGSQDARDLPSTTRVDPPGGSSMSLGKSCTLDAMPWRKTRRS